jgi:hypothetical protein
MAIMTRWRMPPDSSCGYCLTGRRRFGNAHALQPVHAALLRGVAAQLEVDVQNFLELVADAHVRGQRGQRVLEDHGHGLAAHLVQLARRQIQDFLTSVEDRSGRLAV